MITKPMNRTGAHCVSVTLDELLLLSSHAKQFSLSSRCSKNSLSGQHSSRLLARGMEYAESRRYQSGDDIRTIDWRVTARTSKTHTKLFSAEKARPVLLLVDMRSPMFFATQGVFKSVQAALTMGYVAWNTVQSGDQLGGLIINDQSIQEFRPALGKRGLLPFLNGLAENSKLKPQSPNQDPFSKTSSAEKALLALHRMATPGSLVFFVSDFRNLSDFSHNLLLQISRHSDVCLTFVYDRIEAELPNKGVYAVTNTLNELKLNAGEKSSLEAYHKHFNDRKKSIDALRCHRHVHSMDCLTTDDCLDILKKNFN